MFKIKDEERRLIIEALHFNSGNKTMAAKMLGIGRATIYRKLKLYKIEWDKIKQEVEIL